MEKLNEYLREFNFELSDLQIEQFNKYYDLLIEWNKVMNLTTIVEKEDVITRHFLDSIAIINAIELKNRMSIIDVGTGAGFPGIPIKIAFPNVNVTLLDSLNKRVNFLNEVIDKLELRDIEAIHSRAEEGARNTKYRDKYDLCVSRAVANLSTLSEYCLPYVKSNGYFVSYKSDKIEEELNSSKSAIKLLNGKLESVKEVHLPSTDINRNFVIIKKIGSTPKMYPRKSGTASKDPL